MIARGVYQHRRRDSDRDGSVTAPSSGSGQQWRSGWTDSDGGVETEAAGHRRAPDRGRSFSLPIEVGRYLVHSVLGEGGMGIVYRAEDRATGQPVALKTVRVPLEADVAGLRREVRALWRLRHPGVVRILGDGVQGGCPWFAMELLVGSTLKRLNGQLWPARLQGLPSVPPRAAGGRLREVLTVAQKLSRALAFVHGHGIVHRDLKPTNIFLRPDGSPVLVDFGLVCRFPGVSGREVLEVGGLRVGTVHYMAPEQIRAELVDARADLYALGCLMYETITGRRPFEAPTTDDVVDQQLTMEPVRPGALVVDLPREIDELVMRLLNKHPRERPGHAGEVADLLAAHTGVREGGNASVAVVRRFAPPPGVPEITTVLSSAEETNPHFFRPAAAGRRPLFEEMSAVLESASRGRGGLVFIGGPEGMGRTFVLGHLARQAAGRRFNVITGPCVAGAVTDVDGRAADLEGAPLHPFANLLRGIADRCRRSGPSTTDRLLGERGKLLIPFERSLAALWDRRERARGAQRLEPPSARRTPANATNGAAHGPALAALADALVAYGRQEPLVLLLDDLQWADALSLTFLAMLGQGRLDRQAILVVGSYRDESPRWQLKALVERSGARRFALPPLDREAVAAMVGDLLAMSRPPAPLVTWVAARSEGRPAAVVEALRHAHEEGIIGRRDGHWVMRTPVQPVQYPQTFLAPALSLWSR